jgi:hypothetical protein
MKKTIITILISIVVSSICLIHSTAFAQSLVPTKQSTKTVSKVNLISDLPDQSWPQLIASIIKLLLAITGSLAFASFTIGGVMMVTARGNEEQVTKGKDVIFWSILALIAIAVSYGIVVGITQLNLI